MAPADAEVAAAPPPADTRRPAVPGCHPSWHPMGETDHYGRPLWRGDCASCGDSCEVPFMPRQGRDPPLCRQCLHEDEDDDFDLDMFRMR